MANARHPNQRMVGVWLHKEFLRKLEQARTIEHSERSDFIRRAIAADLRRRGIPFDESLIYPPDRAGKPKTAANEISSIEGPTTYKTVVGSQLLMAAETATPAPAPPIDATTADKSQPVSYTQKRTKRRQSNQGPAQACPDNPGT